MMRVLYSSRLTKILSICMNHEEYITYQEISEQLQISTRTVMRELKNINSTLQRYHLTMDFKKGKGIKIIGYQENFKKLKFDLEGTTVAYDSKEERLELLSLELLNNTEIQKIIYYADLFDVSQATISHDLKELENFFKEHHLTVLRRPGLGVKVMGDENNVRNALSVLINKSVGHYLVNVDFDRYNVQEVIRQLFVANDSNMVKLLDQDILKEILEELKDNRDTINLEYMAKNSYIGLLIHLMIAVKRIQKGEKIGENEQLKELVYDQEAYTNATKIVDCLSKKFAINFPESEYLFVAIHLESAKSTVVTNPYNEDYQQYVPIIDAMLEVFMQHKWDLQDDYELYQGIVAHLKPAMIRLQCNLPIYNPMLVQIKEGYLDIFKITQKACQVITKVYGYVINDDEVGYLSLHFGAAIERQKQMVSNGRKIKIGIVCSSGIGISALLSARLQQIVDHNVRLMPLAMYQIDSSDCEILVSTFQLKADNVIVVSPLLSKKDVNRILASIQQKRQEPKEEVKDSKAPMKLMDILMNVQKLLETIDVVSMDYRVHKKELIEIVAQTFMEHSKNIEKVLLEREKKGSNVYHDFGFALFHGTTDSVTHCQIKVIRPDNKQFIKESLRNIKVCLIMLIPEYATTEQRNMMSHISMMLLEDKRFFTSLCRENEENIYRQFDQILKGYLLKYFKEVES